MSEAARKAEANGSAADFEFNGETFTVPTEYDDFPLEFIEAAVDGKPFAIQARELLGPEQWERVRAMRLKGRDMQALVEAIENTTGVASGNSEASSA